MKAKVNILAKPHPYIFFTLQLHSMFESYWLSDSYVQANIPSYMYTDSEAGSYSLFPGHVGGARKWPENEATASFPGHVGGVRKWPENEATAVKLVNL